MGHWRLYLSTTVADDGKPYLEIPYSVGFDVQRRLAESKFPDAGFVTVTTGRQLTTDATAYRTFYVRPRHIVAFEPIED